LPNRRDHGLLSQIGPESFANSLCRLKKKTLLHTVRRALSLCALLTVYIVYMDKKSYLEVNMRILMHLQSHNIVNRVSKRYKVLCYVPGHGTQLERQSLQPFPHEIAAQRHFRRSRQGSLNTNTAIDQPQKMERIEKERGTA
jgi:hypothetical protein